MANSCPECGAEMTFEEHEVRLRSGTCPSCSKEFAVVVGTTVASRFAPSASAARQETAEESITEGASEGAPECEECGGPLVIREGSSGSLAATCEDCDTTTVFVRQSDVMRREGARERPARFDAGASRGRPCRRCGGPLRFSTDETGMLVGECESCGNRFALPPRPGARRENEGRRAPSFGRRDKPYRSRGRPFDRGEGAPRRERSFRGPDRQGSSRSDSEDYRRRRRRQRE